MNKLILFVFVFSFGLISVISAQAVFVPLNNSIYDYLNRLSVKKIISINDEARPYTRKYISALLKEISLNTNTLNNTELEELNWYSQEYSFETGDAASPEPWHLFNYSDSLFQIRATPDVGYGISFTGDNSGYVKWPGLSVFGTYSNWFGASFSYMDKGEFGGNVDREKRLTRQRGAFYKEAPNGIGATDVNGSITFDWQWGNISLIKDYAEWGHGKFGQLFLSDKAPSFPKIQLFLNPVKWLRFYYMHGWLNSLVPDSSYFYYNHLDSRQPYLREKYVNKYIAANMLTVSPFDWLDVSLGNSFIYSGDLRPEMFIPFMYYKVMDHVTGRGDVDDGNGAIFMDVKTNYFKNYSAYASLFIDVLEMSRILENNWWTSWFGYTIGIQNADFIFPNLDLTLEYTKTDSWIYEHKDQSTTYKHYDYTLGHWIGQNADYFRLQFDYELMRGLRLSLNYDRLRKGGLKDIYYAYHEIEKQPFLYGPLRDDYSFGFQGKYEIIHDLHLEASYQYSDISDQDAARTPEFLLGKKNSFSFLLRYGF